MGQFELSPQPSTPNPLTTPTLTPGAQQLYSLEAQFQADVENGGGAAFARWFADDAVVLSNGKAVVQGQDAIAAMSHWSPTTYQLTWTPEGAQMGPAGATGFTWGHYIGHSRDQHGQPVVQEGRYITFWKKVGGAWKVALEASANDVPAADCCSLPKP